MHALVYINTCIEQLPLTNSKINTYRQKEYSVNNTHRQQECSVNITLPYTWAWAGWRRSQPPTEVWWSPSRSRSIRHSTRHTTARSPRLEGPRGPWRQSSRAAGLGIPRSPWTCSPFEPPFRSLRFLATGRCCPLRGLHLKQQGQSSKYRWLGHLVYLGVFYKEI